MCNSHVYFMLHEFRGWPVSLHIFLSMWRYRLQRERWERHPAASLRSQARRVLICWRFVRGMKGSGGAAKSFKAWPSTPLVTKVAQRVLRGLWRNLAPLTLSYAHLSTFPASAGPATVFVTVCVCVCGEVRVRGCPCVFVCLSGAMFGFVWVMNSMLPSAVSHAVCDTEACNKTGPSIEGSISDVTSPRCWSWEFVSISFPLWAYKKASITSCLCSATKPLNEYNLCCICSEKPTNIVLCIRSHAYIINRSIISMSASLMWYHNIMFPCFDPSWLFPSRELLQNLQEHHTLVDPTLHKLCLMHLSPSMETPLTMLFHSTLMEGLQLSVADRHLGQRDS